LNRFSLPIFLLFFFLFALNSYSLPKCEGDDTTKWNNCEGTWIKNGGKFEGEYKDGLPHGKGIFTFPDGTEFVKYVGEFRNNVVEGRGTMTFANGAIYEGEWKGNTMHGKGICTTPDGTKSKCKFKNGVFVE